ncbi:hypothetical protein [Mycoplasma sp. SG1]|uniref:hypothetical protein n=1 Tax=Mycoplasma sp. SG1 TaxID=2810348 RepID=UPI0020248793|nr:hypothetical protein [Mycoplasma sp. SG1]URM52959.1 hypothetical protein JRW51_01275 [Mycoplasma sp. SG1]
MINQIVILGEINQFLNQNHTEAKDFLFFQIVVKNHYSGIDNDYFLKCQIWHKHYLIFKNLLREGNKLLIKGKLVANQDQQIIDVEDLIVV